MAHRSRNTKIICTLGPASANEDMIYKMAIRGMDVVRINCSHGSSKSRQKYVDLVRQVNEKHDLSIKVLIDLEGYRIRVGEFSKKKILEKDQIFFMSNEDDQGESHIPFDYDEDIKTIEKGMNVFMDDGCLHLRVMGLVGNRLKLKVIQGGVLTQRKGINIPTLKLKSNIMTEKDDLNLNFAIENKVDFIAQSFVRNKKDIQRVVERVKDHECQARVISKIENQEGIRNVASIVRACDGILVARGDLGVTVPMYKIPMIQKFLIYECNRRKKISMTATQMLDSMIENGRPTRAEVSDVANAILDGSDYVMLSGETAIGKYPSRSIQMMSQIVHYTERAGEIRI